MQIRYNIEELSEVADLLIEAAGNRTIIAFHADMGVGKTTLIAEIARRLGVKEDMANSPSFAIVNEYETESDNGTPAVLYHFDCYRLETVEEAMEIGVEEYLYSGSLCLIEWPDVIADLLPEETLHVYITEDPESSLRLLTC